MFPSRMWMGGRCDDGDAGRGGAAVPRVPARPSRPSPITCRGLSTFSRNRHGRFRQSDIPRAPLPTVPMAPPRTWAGWVSGAGSHRTSWCSASPTAPTAPSRAPAAGSRAVPLSMVTGSPDEYLTMRAIGSAMLPRGATLPRMARGMTRARRQTVGGRRNWAIGCQDGQDSGPFTPVWHRYPDHLPNRRAKSAGKGEPMPISRGRNSFQLNSGIMFCPARTKVPRRVWSKGSTGKLCTGDAK